MTDLHDDKEVAAAEDDLRTAQIAVKSALDHLARVAKEPDHPAEGGRA